MSDLIKASNFVPDFHVIEKSAYDAVVKERDELKAKHDFRGELIRGMEKQGATMYDEIIAERDALTSQLAEANAERDALTSQLAEANADLEIANNQQDDICRANSRIERLVRALAYAKEWLQEYVKPNKSMIVVEVERMERGE